MFQTIADLLRLLNGADAALVGFLRCITTLIRIVNLCVRYAGWKCPFPKSRSNPGIGEPMPVPYSQPVYNITVNLWRFGTPTSDPPDDTPIANFAWGKRVNFHDGATYPTQDWTPTMTLLVPTGENIRGDVNTDGEPDTAEIPAGSGRFYEVLYVDFIGCGFPNEHLGAVVRMVRGMGPPPPPSEDALTDEAGDELVTEGGDSLVT